jgi:hypothetical protein
VVARFLHTEEVTGSNPVSPIYSEARFPQEQRFKYFEEIWTGCLNANLTARKAGVRLSRDEATTAQSLGDAIAPLREPQHRWAIKGSIGSLG